MQTWNERYKRYSNNLHEAEHEYQTTGKFNWGLVDKIKSELLEIREAKDLSFGERKLLEVASDLLNRNVEIWRKRGHLHIVK